MTRAEFIRRYGDLFDHSPWIVERAAERLPMEDVHAGLMATVFEASAEEQLALICAHPELAGSAALAGELTAASASEQKSAGLHQLDREQLARFRKLNADYRDRFGFPFIICVRLTTAAGILSAIEQRLGNERDQELATALVQIGEIVRLRLEDLP